MIPQDDRDMRFGITAVRVNTVLEKVNINK